VIGREVLPADEKIKILVRMSLPVVPLSFSGRQASFIVETACQLPPSCQHDRSFVDRWFAALDIIRKIMLNRSA